MEDNKPGLCTRIIKGIMIFIFFAIGALLITLGSLSIHFNWDQKVLGGGSYRWLSIVNIVFGCLLLTSPFFLNQKREGLNKIIKILMVIIFVIIGLTLIIGCSVALANNIGEADAKGVLIANLVFGCLLLTSPFFLKR